jgi:hypothetical protein
MLLSPLDLLKLLARKTKQSVVAADPIERRKSQRFVVNPQVKLSAMLIASGSGAKAENEEVVDTVVEPRELQGRLVDCSKDGVRLEMTPVAKMDVRQLVGVSLKMADFEINIPCVITHVRDDGELISFGLKHDISDSKSWNAYRRLLDVLSLGSTLMIHSRTNEPSESGYFQERYVGDRPASLTVWRHSESRDVVAFAFQLQDGILRVAYGDDVQYLRLGDSRFADPDLAREIHRRFNLAMPNVAPAVPEDVRDFMGRYAA